MNGMRLGLGPRLLGLGALCGLAGCGVLPFLPAPGSGSGSGSGAGQAGDPGAPIQTVAAPDTRPAGAAPPPPPPEARTVEQFDTTSAAERAEASAPQAAPTSARLGTTIASLGDPTDPGFWAETPLVTEVRPGRLDYPETGKSVQVELRPSGGAPGSGTRVSLPALRLLEAPLTALPELVVFGL